MIAPYRILIPLDGSSEAEESLSSILPLARHRSVKVMLLAVVSDSALVEKAREYLAGVLDFLSRQEVQASMRVTCGDPVREILLHAGPHARDLVAMTTHGRKGLEKLLLGSVTSEVLHRASVPLLLNRGEVPVSGWKQMVVALDGSPRAERILESALPIAKLLGSTVHLVAVEKDRLLFSDPAAPGSEGESLSAPEYLERIASRLKDQEIPADTAVRSGAAAQEILRYRQELGAGLIALATHGRTGLGRILMGSVAEEVVRSTACPVLLKPVVHRPSLIEARSSTGGGP